MKIEAYKEVKPIYLCLDKITRIKKSKQKKKNQNWTKTDNITEQVLKFFYRNKKA